ncbi:MAG: RHS repeat-associated core domain-containing protein, partial [Alphaproteobacteria bacterium]|nr:RHS repeat-associated core domain-containing protein [Alphaproteobacteria bacterium]
EVLCLYKGSSTYYYHADGQGSTGMVTDVSQNVVERYRYDVFGLVQIRNGSGAVIAASAMGNRYLYTGREWEPEIRTYHYRARMYHPGLGRFLQRDPIGFGDDFNLYRYVKNSPVNFVDPWGLEALAQDRNGNAYVPIWEDPIVWLVTAGMGGPVKTVLDLMRYDRYWKYMSEGSDPTGPYLTGKNASQPPYRRDYIEARDKLQLPKYPSDVISVKVPKSEPVAGPQKVQGNPDFGKGGGDEWFRGKQFPSN